MTSDSLQYQTGFANEFASEALPGALPVGTELAAALSLRPVCRAVLGHGVHGAAPREPTLLAVSHPAGGTAPAVRAARAGRA